MRRNRILMLISFFSFLCREAQADIVFPAIVHQYFVSLVVPSYYSVLLAVLVLLAEAFFIKKYLSRGWLDGFCLAFLLNLFSSILGFFIVTFLEGFTREVSMGIFGYHNMRMGTYLGMIPGYGITVLVEWLFLLFWVKWIFKLEHKPESLIKLSLIMNFCSYLILSGGVFIADIMTKGQNFQTF